MGDPPKLRNKYEGPKRLWAKERVVRDKGLKTEYGLKSMKELWKADSILRKVRREARRLLSISEEDRKADERKLLSSLVNKGMLKSGSKVDDILGLNVRVVLERRLQTLVVRKGLARTFSQARQLIVHGFVSVAGKKVTVPSYLVVNNEENEIAYAKQIDLSITNIKSDQQSNVVEEKKNSSADAQKFQPEAAAS
jgi:small subunit ribosomal protein S4